MFPFLLPEQNSAQFPGFPPLAIDTEKVKINHGATV
jgi:hypothetical protein